MESIYTELALSGRKNECARTDNVFFPISQVCNYTVSLENGIFCYLAQNINLGHFSFIKRPKSKDLNVKKI